MPKIVRVTTVPTSLVAFCSGLASELSREGYEVVAVSSPGQELEQFARQEGVRAVAVPMERHISLLRDLRSLWRMTRVLRREQPSMVHSMTPKAGLIAMMAAWLCRVPVRVHTFTGLVWPTAHGLKRRLLMLTDWLTCACATHIVPEGEGVKNDLLNHHITRKPLEVLGHGNVRGIDLDYYYHATFEEKDSDLFTFVFVGRIVRDKGMHELAEAMRWLAGRCRLILVGDLEQELDPIDEADKAFFETCPHIDMVGAQADVRPFYARAHALVFPSYREGFPNVVLEAGAMGLPCIVTNINGSREIIIDGKNGVVVDPANAQALYEAMLRWIEHPAEAHAMARQARPLIASRFEQGYVRHCLKTFYHHILNRPMDMS